MYGVNIRVEYEPTRIRHCAIQCPCCKKWFNDYDISLYPIGCEYDIISGVKCKCPYCNENFEAIKETINIEECGSVAEVHKDTMVKKVTWVEERDKE